MKEVLTHQASRAQQQLWFVEQLVPGEPVHNISFERRYAGRLDATALRAAVADVVGRHESLRTRFEVRDNSLWQVVLTPPDEPPVEFVELSGSDPEQAYRDLCTRAGTEVFDLRRAPLLRVVHARLGGEADALVVVLHHMVADAISAEIFMRELTVAYERRVAGNAPDWPELPVQYADFTAWQEERSTEAVVRDDVDYWRTQLADLSTVDLTYGRPRPSRFTQRGRRLHFTIEPGVASALDEFVRAERATAFMGLLAAYAATLARVFGAQDVAMATTVSGRPLPELQDLIGMFIDQVVLRLDLSDGPTFRELVRSARRVVSEAHDHGAVTFDQIVAAVAPERVAGMTPLAQAAINLQPPAAPRPPAGPVPKATGGSLIDTGTVTHDLWLDIVPDPTPYTGTVRYRPDVLDDAAAELVCEIFPLLLAAALAEPDRPMWTFDVLPAADLSVELDADLVPDAQPGERGYVADPWGRPVPAGCRGEVWIGPPDTARRSGVWARRRPDGRLEFDTDRQLEDEPAAKPALEEPATPIERALLDGWQWLLPKAEFGVTDDFFDIGGDSILAIHAVTEARREGYELTVPQILKLRTIRALAKELDAPGPARRPAPLGIAGPTVVRVAGPVSGAPPGVTVEGDVLTADPSDVDDWSLARVVRQHAPGGTAASDGVLGLPLPAETAAALTGPAHEAYATTTTDLLVAATLAATGAPALAVADTRREVPAASGDAVPGLLRIGPATGEADLIQSVKAALLAPEDDDPVAPGVRVIPLPDNAFVTGIGDAGTRVVVTLAGTRLIVTGEVEEKLAERVRDHLVRLVEHCAAAETVYSATDFPDAGLDDDAVAGLLAGLDEAAP